METLTVRHTYGKALFDAAQDLGKTDAIGDEFFAVSKVFADNPILKKLFILPTVSAEKKKAVCKNVFGGRISRELVSFICILIDKRRISAWEGIGREYEKLQFEAAGFTKGILYSVVPVEGKRLEAFDAKASAALGKTVKLENRIDPTLIGGVKIYADGKLIDASVKSRLEHLKQRIKL